ncbi:MAG: TonB-dependent receptor [Bacteroidetes bacterium]|nr:TonB-dependent receptor [Bacteroidota bacterium]HET6244787.1 TonB-dependent receptor [Bacteroidia bacterium]
MTMRKIAADIFLLPILFFMVTCFLQAQTDTVPAASKLSELTLEELMNMEVVTASGSEQKITEAPATMLVVTSRQISERGYEQLSDVLRDLPGVDLIHTYGRAPTFITFRGMYGDENKRVLLMIDGIVENSIMGGYEMAGPAYSLFNVDRIEIMWGPGSALYGANAFSAVINIITKKGAEINGIHYQKGYGSFNTQTENVMFGLTKSGPPEGAIIDLAVSASLYNTDGPRFTNRHPRYSNSYVDNAWSFNGNVTHTIKKFKTTLGGRIYQTPSGWGTITASPTMLIGLPSQGMGNTGNGGTMQAIFNGERPSLFESFARTAFLRSQFTPNSKITLLVEGQYRKTGSEENSYIYSNLPETGYLSRNPLTYFANRIRADVSATFAITEQQRFSAGILYFQDNLERGVRGFVPDTLFDTIQNIPVTNVYATFKPREFTIQNNIGVFMQYILKTTLLNKTNFTAGWRIDNNSIYGNTLNPRAGIINQPNEKLTFKVLAGSAFRGPSNFELYTVVGGSIANPDLIPEKIQTYELNIIYYPIKILMVQGNLFQNHLKDIIVQDVPIGGGRSQILNIGTATTRGLEAKFEIIPSNSFSAFVNYTLQEGKQDDGNMENEIPNIARARANIGISMLLSDLVNISLIANWVGARSVAETNPLNKVNGYFIPNLVITTNKIFDNRVSASLNIENLFNQTYYDPGIRAANGNFYGTVHEQLGINGFFKILLRIF